MHLRGEVDAVGGPLWMLQDGCPAEARPGRDPGLRGGEGRSPGALRGGEARYTATSAAGAKAGGRRIPVARS